MSAESDYKPSNMYSDSISRTVRSESTTSYQTTAPTAPPMDLTSGQSLYPGLHQESNQMSFKRGHSSGFVDVPPSDIPVADNYSRQVFRIGTISYTPKKVMGMVMVDNILYVLHKKSNVLDKYNIEDTQARSFVVPPVTNHVISGLQYPRGLAANHRNGGCLFITDRRGLINTSLNGRIMKVSLEGAVVTHTEFDYEPFGVSVAPENERVIVACCKNTFLVPVPLMGLGYIVIFEDANGKLREQQLISLAENIGIPRYVLEAPQPAKPGKGKEYLVVHGWIRLPGVECHHRVSRINSNGRAMTSFGVRHGDSESQLDRPMSICLDDSDKMFLSDSFNDRVLLMTRTPNESYDLALLRPLVTSANGLSRPRHVCLDTKKRLLYVGQDNGHINVFLVGTDSKVSGQTQITEQQRFL